MGLGSEGMEQCKFGIIDMGSHSIRFVLYRRDRKGRVRKIENVKHPARLSIHKDNAGNITPEGMQIILDSLHQFQKLTRYHRVNDVRGVATAALRQAPNRTDVLEMIEEHSDFRFKILSEQQEAYYGYLAVVHSTNIKNGVTIDIGGGSTEITLFSNQELKHSHSFPFGAISLTRKFIQNDPLMRAEMDRLSSFLKEQFESLPWLHKYMYPVIGIGGNARNVSSIHQHQHGNSRSGFHQYEMEPESMKKINDRLMLLPLAKRQNVEGLSADRADIIIPAIEAMYMVTQVTRAPVFVLSRRGLRDGIYFEQVLKSDDNERIQKE